MSARGIAFKLLGSRSVTAMAVQFTKHRLRILAYHGIADEAAFGVQLEEIVHRFTPVSGSQVAAALAGHSRLPSRAIWLTFDDGFPEVETLGRPLLEAYGITATLFVCPGVVDTDEPYWWEIVREAARIGIADRRGLPVVASLEFELKTVSDAQRREVVAALAAGIEARCKHPYRRTQMASAQLRNWAAAGQEVGNHTWDHPLLNQCEGQEQRRQIYRAHEWLRDTLGQAPLSCAYPNGNWASFAEDELRGLGYQIALGFDHRLTASESRGLRMSRLRLDTNSSRERFRAVASGLHPALHAARGRLPRATTEVDDRRLPC
ncbi:MAG: polysaccharide deacetylase family protein [Dehalococcoidia bacterium]